MHVERSLAVPVYGCLKEQTDTQTDSKEDVDLSRWRKEDTHVAPALVVRLRD